MKLLYELLVRLEYVWYVARFRVAESLYGLAKGFAYAAIKVCPEHASEIQFQDTSDA